MADEGPTKDELLEKAKALNIEGRSGMSKDELERAIVEATRGPDMVTPREGQFQEPAVVYAEEGEHRVSGEEIVEPSGEGVADQSSLTPPPP